MIFFVGSATGVLTLPPSPEPALATPLEPASPAPEPLLLPAATPLELGLPPELELPPEAGFAEAPLLAPVGAAFPLELPLDPVPLLGVRCSSHCRSSRRRCWCRHRSPVRRLSASSRWPTNCRRRSTHLGLRPHRLLPTRGPDCRRSRAAKRQAGLIARFARTISTDS